MESHDPIPRALQRIADVLSAAKDYPKHATDIESLLALATSQHQGAESAFRKEITTNKWYWLGMGSIADISFTDRTAQHEFVSAYYDLALACQRQGLRSIYSENVESIFGKWLREGHV